MNKSEFVNVVAERADLTKKQTEEILDIILDTISEIIVDGDKVVFSGFGTFEIHERAERVGRNPQTGEEIKIAGSKAITFKAGKQLKEALNN